MLTFISVSKREVATSSCEKARQSWLRIIENPAKIRP